MDKPNKSKSKPTRRPPHPERQPWHIHIESDGATVTVAAELPHLAVSRLRETIASASGGLGDAVAAVVKLASSGGLGNLDDLAPPTWQGGPGRWALVTRDEANAPIVRCAACEPRPGCDAVAAVPTNPAADARESPRTYLDQMAAVVAKLRADRWEPMADSPGRWRCPVCIEAIADEAEGPGFNAGAAAGKPPTNGATVTP